MGYKVLDEKGVAYMDDGRGRQVIPCGAILDEKLVEKGYFSQDSIALLIKAKRLEGIKKDAESGPIKSPSNKKADVKDKKGAKNK